MFVLSNLLVALATIIDIGLTVYILFLIVSVVVSWVAPASMHPAIVLVRRATEPVLVRIRRLMPFVYQSGIDFSPIIAFLAIMFLQRFLVPTLYQLADRLR